MGKIVCNEIAYGGSSSVEDADHLMVDDGSGNTISAQTMIENILGDIGTIEESSVATQNYSKGSYIVLNGYFYKVTTAITSGDTLTEGTNIIRTSVGAEINPKAKRIYVDKSVAAGGDVTIQATDIYNALGFTASDKKIIAFIPEGIRPLSSWGCNPTLFWMDTYGTYLIHNLGKTADTARAYFVCIYRD